MHDAHAGKGISSNKVRRGKTGKSRDQGGVAKAKNGQCSPTYRIATWRGQEGSMRGHHRSQTTSHIQPKRELDTSHHTKKLSRHTR